MKKIFMSMMICITMGTTHVLANTNDTSCMDSILAISRRGLDLANVHLSDIAFFREFLNRGIVEPGSLRSTSRSFHYSNQTFVLQLENFRPNGLSQEIIITPQNDGEIMIKLHDNVYLARPALNDDAFRTQAIQGAQGYRHSARIGNPNLRLSSYITSLKTFSLDNIHHPVNHHPVNRVYDKSLAFTNDGTQFVALDARKRIAFFDAFTGRQIRVLPVRHNNLRNIKFTTDGQKMILDFHVNNSRDYSHFRIINTRTGDDVVASLGKYGSSLNNSFGTRNISRNGRKALMINQDGNVKVKDLETNRSIELDETFVNPRSTYYDYLSQISEDGQLVVLVDSESRKVKLYNTQTGAMIHSFDPPRGGSGSLWGMQLSPNGDKIAFNLQTSVLTVYDIRTAQFTFTHGFSRAYANPLIIANFSMDGERIVTGTAVGGGLEIVDLNRGSVLRGNISHGNSIAYSADFSSDGRRLLVYDSLGKVTVVLIDVPVYRLN